LGDLKFRAGGDNAVLVIVHWVALTASSSQLISTGINVSRGVLFLGYQILLAVLQIRVVYLNSQSVVLSKLLYFSTD